MLNTLDNLWRHVRNLALNLQKYIFLVYNRNASDERWTLLVHSNIYIEKGGVDISLCYKLVDKVGIISSNSKKFVLKQELSKNMTSRG